MESEAARDLVKALAAWDRLPPLPPVPPLSQLRRRTHMLKNIARLREKVAAEKAAAAGHGVRPAENGTRNNIDN